MAADLLATSFTRVNVGIPSSPDQTDGSLTAAGNVKAEGNLVATGSITAASLSLTAESVTGGSPSAGSAGMLYLAVSLSAADIIAMNATPKTLIAAPGSGKAIVLHRMMLRMTRTSTAFTSGGAVVAQYHTGAVAATGTIASTVVTGAAGVADYAPVAVAAAVVENDALELTNATGAFATGTGTGVVYLWYSIV